MPDGNYAFQFNGNAAGGNPVAINGVFEVLKGVVGIGVYSENELNQAPTSGQAFTGGSASIATNGLGQLELSLQSGNVTFALAAPASALKSGSDSDIRIIEFDDTTGTGMRGSGVLKTANFNGSLSAIKGGYAFAFSGWDTHSQPAALAGSFQADGLGNITSGTADMNDNGTLSSYAAVTGSYTTDPVGSGVITLKLSASLTVTYNYYQVTPTELLATSGDLSSSTIPLVSGLALQQTGPFTNASFTGVNVLELNGNAPQTAAFIPDITLGLLTSDGNGNVTASYDEYKASLLAPQTYTATYVVDPATGRTPITSGGTKAILYLVSDTKAFVLGGDASTSSGLLEAQRVRHSRTHPSRVTISAEHSRGPISTWSASSRQTEPATRSSPATAAARRVFSPTRCSPVPTPLILTAEPSSPFPATQLQESSMSFLPPERYFSPGTEEGISPASSNSRKGLTTPESLAYVKRRGLRSRQEVTGR